MVLCAMTAAAAHGAFEPGENPLAAWPFAPEIIVALLAAGWIYWAGIRATERAKESGRLGSHVAFFGGLFALFLALQSPIEVIADHVFVVHQVEHMLLRTVGPMLIMLAAPQATLMRGLPNGVRRRIITPLVANGLIQRLFTFLEIRRWPRSLFVGTTYFWMVPRYHDLAILDEPIHYLWHVSLLISGLFFFWRSFDPRPYPLGTSLTVRLLMFWTAAMGNILLGAYLSFKPDILYQAYGILVSAMGTGCLGRRKVRWAYPMDSGCMMLALAALATLHRWGDNEERTEVRRQFRKANPRQPAADTPARQQSRNRTLAVGLAGFHGLCFSCWPSRSPLSTITPWLKAIRKNRKPSFLRRFRPVDCHASRHSCRL